MSLVSRVASLVARPGRKTNLQASIADFGAKYASYKPDERAVVIALLSTIYTQTKHKAFDRLAGDLGPLVMSLAPVVAGGNAPGLLVLAVHSEAQELERDLSKAIGRHVWEAEVARAASQVQG